MNNRFTTGLAALLMVLALHASAFCAEAPAPSDPIALWPNGAPGEKGDVGEEVDAEPAPDKVRLTNVTRPTITVYRPAADKATGAAVLVCPGGGYNRLAMDIEGTEICDWLNAQGVTAVLLKYRVPRRTGIEKHAAPLQDAQRAMGLVRQRAKEWDIDPQRVGVIGFSAGGHLAAVLSTRFEQRTYPTVDEADAQSCRPDFAMLIYPFYLTGEDKTPGMTLAPEFNVSERTPA